VGLTSVIIGILAILLSWIPCLWPIVVIHVLIGLGTGAAEIISKNKSATAEQFKVPPLQRGDLKLGVVGISLNVIAIILTVSWQLFWNTDGFSIF